MTDLEILLSLAVWGLLVFIPFLVVAVRSYAIRSFWIEIEVLKRRNFII